MRGTQTNRSSPGMLTAIVLAAAAAFWAAAANAQGDSGWSTWQNLDRSFTYPEDTDVPVRLSATVFYDRRPIIVTVARNGWMSFREERLGFWGPWFMVNIALGAFATDAVAENGDRRLEVFVVAGDGAAWHIYQNQPNCCWSEWESLGRPTWASRSEPLLSELRVVNRRTRSLELFAPDQQGRLWTIYQQ